MKLLVLGSNGMAGHMIALYLAEQGHEVLGFAREKSPCVDTIIGDALDGDSVKSALGHRSFDAVINCIGILNQFAQADKPRAVLLNAYLPHSLAELTKSTPTKIIQISTDCVFSGKRGRYTEDDMPDGPTFYDRTKALGELNDDKNLTLRGSIVGPDMNPQGIGLLNWFMRQTDTVTGYTKSLWTGQTTLQLAKTIEAALSANATGLVHCVPDSHTSKYDLLCLFNHYIRKDKLTIRPVDGIVQDKTLIRTHRDFAYPIPDYRRMVQELSVWMHRHRNLYPHYLIDEKAFPA